MTKTEKNGIVISREIAAMFDSPSLTHYQITSSDHRIQEPSATDPTTFAQETFNFSKFPVGSSPTNRRHFEMTELIDVQQQGLQGTQGEGTMAQSVSV